MTACTSKEESVWKQHLEKQASTASQLHSECHDYYHAIRSTVSLDITPTCAATYYAQSQVRDMHTRRGGVDDLGVQVIIKNTLAVEEDSPPKPTVPQPVKRSHSVLSTSHIPVLSPKRNDRARLETALYDIWTKELLPYPGLPYRRSESAMRVLPHAVMRKISMGSITSTFSKRSASYSTTSHHSRMEEINNSIASRDSRSRLKRAKMPSRVEEASRIPSPAMVDRPATAPQPPAVDFHTAPTAFLPPDFNLDMPIVVKKRELARPVSLESSNPVASPKRPEAIPISTDAKTTPVPESTRSTSGATLVPLLARSSNPFRRRSMSVQKAEKIPLTKEISAMVKEQNIALAARVAATPFADPEPAVNMIGQQVDGHTDPKKPAGSRNTAGRVAKEGNREHEKMSKSLGLRDRSRMKIRRLFMV